jgi:bile acid:Na+ symporter, BASS family
MKQGELIDLAVVVTLVEMMVAIGLRVPLTELGQVARQYGLLARAALANYVIVPLAAAALLALVAPLPAVAAGILTAAACPGAPFGPPFTGLARGHVATAVGLMVILSASSALLAPLVLQVLLPWVDDAGELCVRAPVIVRSLLLIQILPLSAGLALRHWAPRLAHGIEKPASTLSAVLNLLTLGLILAVHGKLLLQIRIVGLVAMLALAAIAAAGGWVLGGPGAASRRTLAVTTCVRNGGLALVLASASFPGTAALTAVIAFGVVQTGGMALAALAWGRLVARQPS